MLFSNQKRANVQPAKHRSIDSNVYMPFRQNVNINFFGLVWSSLLKKATCVVTLDRKERRNEGSRERVQFLSIPLHTQRHTRPLPALHSSNQIKFLARSQLVLYLENVLGAEHKHVTVRKPKGPMLTKKTFPPLLNE